MMSSLINQVEFMLFGLEILLMGMGTVFTFLILLILVTSLMSRLVNYFQPMNIQGTNSTVEQNHSAQADTALSDELLNKIIRAAIHQHRSDAR